MATDLVYLQNSQMRIFYDRRRVVELLADDNTGDDITNSQMDDPTTAPGSLLWAAINWASSEIDAKCQNGKRYLRSDLEEIVQQAVSPPPGSTAAQIEEYKKRAAVLQKLCADLAFGFLAQRRAQSADQIRMLAPAYEEALRRLEELYLGMRIFDRESTIAATVPSSMQAGRGSQSQLSSGFNRLFGSWSTSPDNYRRY